MGSSGTNKARTVTSRIIPATRRKFAGTFRFFWVGFDRGASLRSAPCKGVQSTDVSAGIVRFMDSFLVAVPVASLRPRFRFLFPVSREADAHWTRTGVTRRASGWLACTDSYCTQLLRIRELATNSSGQACAINGMRAVKLANICSTWYGWLGRSFRGWPCNTLNSANPSAIETGLDELASVPPTTSRAGRR